MAKGNIPAGDKAQVLFAAAAHGHCYNPTCDTPLLVERGGVAIINFAYAHIRDEQPPSDLDADIGWRYWPDDLTQRDRNHFSNILLLCAACHKLIDKINPRAYPVELLVEWKQVAEGATGPGLATLLGSLTPAELDELAVRIAREHEVTRDVRVTVEGAAIVGGGMMTGPIDGFFDLLSANDLKPDLIGLAVRATNHGWTSATVTSVSLEFVRPGRVHHPRLMLANPLGLNQRLPARLDPGELLTWFVTTDELLAAMDRGGREVMFVDAVAVVELATGEWCRAHPVSAELIPLWDNPDEVADAIRLVREQASSSSRGSPSAP